ncbi:hypothetical protein RBB77_20655 [Tunturibacter psychrotolerans]|uniref:Uncharacterized protein n=1 Tax=Tunturiibacter psychrotolerans TaxID=3069686 RepID=A0AAU7ZPD8_9BACT
MKDVVDLYLITVLEKQFTLKTGGKARYQFSREVGSTSSDGYAGCPERGRRSVLGSTYHSLDDIAEETELGMPFGRILIQQRRLVE